MIEDPALYQAFKTNDCTLEVCPSSNVHTGVVAQLDQHPVGQFVKGGLAVTISTDNRLISDTTVTAELANLVSAFRWNKERVLSVVAQSFVSVFMPEDKKLTYLEQVKAFLGKA